MTAKNVAVVAAAVLAALYVNQYVHVERITASL